MIKRGWLLLLILFMVVGLSDIAGAALKIIGSASYNGKDYNLIYEDGQGLIWLDYTNPSSVTGWDQQMEWASGLNASGILTYKFNAGVSVSWNGDWRLPLTVDGPHRFGYDGTTTAGFNITTCEMGHLYYKSLGNPGYYNTKGNPRPGWGKPESEYGWGLKNTAPFVNLQKGRYWSSTEYSINPMRAWDFNTYWGSTNNNAFKASNRFSSIAVRPGKVVFNTAP
jgi:hypothetical protein